MRKFIEIGEICRSSRYLCKKMLENIDFSRDLNIVEFGPGDGIFTSEILKRMSKDSKLTIFEINDNFYNIVKSKYKDVPNIEIIKESASNINSYFNEKTLDYIVSGLPLRFIKKEVALEILQNSKIALKDDGKFIQFQYFLQNRKQIKSTFGKVKYSFTPINIPPAFVYTCEK